MVQLSTPSPTVGPQTHHHHQLVTKHSTEASRLCDRPPERSILSLYLAVDSARTAVGRSTSRARQSGTRYQMNLEILTVLITLNGS